MPGPLPKPVHQRRRRNPPVANTRKLPAEGRKGETPPWPLSRPPAAESRVWEEAWKTPQATVWEELGWTRTVARYVRLVVQVEKPKASTETAKEARQLEDRLGLTPMAMLRLRWEVDDGAERDVPLPSSSVRRLRAVDPEGMA